MYSEFIRQLTVSSRVLILQLMAVFLLIVSMPFNAQSKTLLSNIDPDSSEFFSISDIRVEGLQRISPGAVFSALPVGVGDIANTPVIRAAIKNLFATGNFDDISISSDGNVLVISVVERPSISEIIIDGNKAIETGPLLDGLKSAGLSIGSVFQRSTLEGMQLELQRQYVLQGRYDATITTDIIPEPRNRVSIAIDVKEGTIATIKHINIVGNTHLGDEELKGAFELKPTGWFSFFSSDDQYSKEKLTSDLESLESYYMNRGYLQFNIDSIQVALSPDKEAVYVTINVTEGKKFIVGEVGWSGDFVLSEDELNRFLLVSEGQVFSQILVTRTEENIARRLGDEGYNFVKVTGIPVINEDDSTVEIKFFVDPGKRTYVRRINFSGNLSTADNVLRRELRQMESAPASVESIEQGRVRLQRLGFFKTVEIETNKVPGYDDLIDLDYRVEEQSFGSIGGSIGYAQDIGLILGLNLQQKNFLGTGRQVNIDLDRSRYQDVLSFAYVDPYFTEDGVSRGFNIYYRRADLSEINVSSYITNTVGALINFGYPISETQRLGFSFGVSDTDISAGQQVVQEIKSSPNLQEGIDSWYESTLRADGTYATPEYLRPLAELPPGALTVPERLGFLDLNGTEYLNYVVSGSWLESTVNRGQLATRGRSQSISFQASIPSSDLEFYKLGYRGEVYFPLYQEFTLHLRTELGYGNGYGELDILPFYEHYFAGGFGSVRGYRLNTLGPRSTPPVSYVTNSPVTRIDEDGNSAEIGGPLGQQRGYVVDPVTGKVVVQSFSSQSNTFGGNLLMEGTMEILFPMPFIKDRSSLRSAIFLDVGNVFNTTCSSNQFNCVDVSLNELRYSVGIGVTWISGFGPITFSLAKPFNAKDMDQLEIFQFTLGRSF